IKGSMHFAGRLGYGAAPALADLDGDCIPEIIVQTDGYLNVWRGDGSVFPAFPVPVPGAMGNSSPVVGDVDGDGLPDLVITTHDWSNNSGWVWVFDRSVVLHPR